MKFRDQIMKIIAKLEGKEINNIENFLKHMNSLNLSNLDEFLYEVKKN